MRSRKVRRLDMKCMSLSEYHQMVEKDLQVSEDIVIWATQFCHDLGDVLYYPQHELVFLRPSFLVDIFKLIIRHDHEAFTTLPRITLINGKTVY